MIRNLVEALYLEGVIRPVGVSRLRAGFSIGRFTRIGCARAGVGGAAHLGRLSGNLHLLPNVR
jgi:hypothetical protein